MIQSAFASHRIRAFIVLAAAAAILVPAAPAIAVSPTAVPSVRPANWGTDLAAAGAEVRIAAQSGDVESLESAVSDANHTLSQLSKQPNATQSSVAARARELKALAAKGEVISYQLRTQDCKQNSIARMASIARKVRDGKSTLPLRVAPGDRKLLSASLGQLSKDIAKCLHLTLTFDSFMTSKEPIWEIAGQFEVPLEFRMDAKGKPYWAGKQTGIVENATLANRDGCTWTVDPKPFRFEVARLELSFISILGTTSGVNLKEYSTDATMIDTANGSCPDAPPIVAPLWSWSMIFADMRGYLDSATWPELRDWQVPANAPDAEMYKVLKGATNSEGFTESSTMFLYRR